jgi:hypothetical protein
MNPLAEQYVRHARRNGDPQVVYETAERDILLSPADLGWVAAQLRRFDPDREANRYRDGNGRMVSWPKFVLHERQKDRLGRRLTEDNVPVKTIATYMGSTTRWVKDRAEYWRAASEWVELTGVVPCYGIGPPIDLLDGNLDPGLYGVLGRILGYPSRSRSRTPDRLSGSGVGGEIVDVGLRFERLEVVRMERDATGRKVAVCRCDCGGQTTAKPSHLLRGEKRSCGCLRRERIRARREVVR